VLFDNARASGGIYGWHIGFPDLSGTRLSLVDHAAPRRDPELLQPGLHPDWMTLPSQQHGERTGLAQPPDSSAADHSIVDVGDVTAPSLIGTVDRKLTGQLTH